MAVSSVGQSAQYGQNHSSGHNQRDNRRDHPMLETWALDLRLIGQCRGTAMPTLANEI
jgi:hypothetical protein